METKDLIIYKSIETAAQKLFNTFDIPAGKYTAKELIKLPISAAFPENFDETDIIRVSVDTFSCAFPAGAIFDTLAQLETAWGIPSARRAQFIKKADAAPVAVSFDLSALIKETAKARETEKDKKELRPNMALICIDTARRAVVASNGHILTAVAVPDMYVSQDAEKEYLISADLLKTGKGTLTIDTAKNCMINGQIVGAADRDNLRFPNWETVCPAISEDEKIYLGKDFIKLLKKELSAVAKTNQFGRVSIFGTAGNNNITLSAVDYDNNKETNKNVSLPQPLTFDFRVLIDNKQFAAVPAAVDSVYLHPFKNGAGCLLFAGAGCLFLLMPLFDNDLIFAPVAEDAEKRPAVAVAAFAELNSENSARAVASVQDQQTAPAVQDAAPAAEDAGHVEIVGAEFVPALDEEIKTAVNGVLLGYYWPAKFAGCLRDIFGRAYLAKNNVYFDELNGTFSTRAGKLFAVASETIESAEQRVLYQDAPENEINVLFGTDAEKFVLSQRAQDEETAAPVAEDEETAPAVQDAPAVPAAVRAQLDILNNCTAANNVAPGLIMKHKYLDNLYIVIIDYTNKGYKTKEITIYNSRKRPDLKTKFFTKLDVFPSEKALFNYCAVPAELANVLYILDEETKKIAAPVAAAAEDAPAVAVADSVPAADPVAAVASVQDETAQPVPFENKIIICSVPKRAKETAPAVQDAPAVANCLPVPCFVEKLHAVYLDGCLHGVYYSQLLADEEFYNLFFAGRSVDFVSFPANETPAALLENVPAVASVQDEETAPAVAVSLPAADSVPAEDETAQPAPFASIFAIMPEIWETAAPAAEDETNGAPADSVPFLDEETPAPFAAEDAPAVAAFYLAAEFSRRARRVFSFAAALLSLLLITAAPRFIASVAVQETAPAVQKTPAPAADPVPAFEDAQPVPAAELRNSPETAPAVAADSLPAVAKKQPRNARKRARRVNPDNLAPAVAVSLPAPADSVHADSVPFVAAADSVPFLETAAPADSVPAVASVAADSITAAPAEDAPAVQDAAPAAEDEETAPAVPADSVPAEDAPAPANSPAPAVPVSSVAVPGCPGVPAALLLILML